MIVNPDKFQAVLLDKRKIDLKKREKTEPENPRSLQRKCVRISYRPKFNFR